MEADARYTDRPEGMGEECNYYMNAENSIVATALII